MPRRRTLLPGQSPRLHAQVTPAVLRFVDEDPLRGGQRRNLVHVATEYMLDDCLEEELCNLNYYMLVPARVAAVGL